MKTVWKFPINAIEEQSVSMPTGAKLLHVDAQGSGINAQPCLWALVDTEAPRANRRIGIVGTDHPSDRIAERTHVGSFMLGMGALVFHVFDLGEEKAS